MFHWHSIWRWWRVSSRQTGTAAPCKSKSHAGGELLDASVNRSLEQEGIATLKDVKRPPLTGVAWEYLRAVGVELMFPLLLLIVTVLLVHFESRTTFPNRDTLIYSIVADRWSSGAIPYRDIVDHKPPGIYALYRTFFFVGERSPRSIWQGMTWVAGLASLSVYLGFRTHKRFAAGVATGVGLFALMSADTLGLGAHAQNNTESLAVAWAAVAFGLMLGYQRSRSIWWVVGGGCGLCCCRAE